MNLARRAMPLLGIAAIALGGCDSGLKYEHAKVHGKVTYQGKPLTFGSVLFMPMEAPKEGLIQPASGSINPDGTYELKSQSDAGAILGEHRVLVIAVDGGKPAEVTEEAKGPSPANASKSGQYKSAIPKKYSDPGASPLIRKVVPGDNTIDIDITG